MEVDFRNLIRTDRIPATASSAYLYTPKQKWIFSGIVIFSHASFQNILHLMLAKGQKEFWDGLYHFLEERI